MVIKNASKWCQYSLIHQYAISIFIVGLAYFFSGYVFPVISETRPHSLFVIASFLIATEFGFKPGIFVCFFGFAIVNHQFIPPVGDLSIPTSHQDFVDIGVILISTTAVIYIVEKYQRERYKNKLLLLVSESRQQILLHRENQRLMMLNKKTTGI